MEEVGEEHEVVERGEKTRQEAGTERRGEWRGWEGCYTDGVEEGDTESLFDLMCHGCENLNGFMKTIQN